MGSALALAEPRDLRRASRDQRERERERHLCVQDTHRHGDTEDIGIVEL